MLLALALLTPRLAPAFSWAIDGHQSVWLCTGTGLVRLTVDEDGQLVQPEAGAERHCDLVGTPRCVVQYRWQALGEQRLATRVRLPGEERPTVRALCASPPLGARGPPDRG